MIGRHKLDVDELRTATSEIEAILNDRTLTQVPSEVDSIETLTPSHLLYGRKLTILPCEELREEELEDPNYGMDNDRLTKIFSRRQNVIRTFWKKWRDRYLPTLRSHHQATKGSMKGIIQIGDVVQIHDDKKG